MSNDSELDLDLLLDEDDELNSSRSTHDEDLDEKERSAASHDDDDDSVFSDDDDDDDDVKPRGKPDPKADVAGDDDEDEEEEIIKPALNPVIVGMGALAVAVLAGGAGYVMLNKNNSDQNNESPTVTTSMPAPSFEELGKDLSIPSTNLVDEDAEKPIVAGAATALPHEKAPAETLPSIKAAVEPSVAVPAPIVNVPAVAAGDISNDVASVDKGDKVVPVVAVPAPVLSSVSSTPASIDADDNVSKQELKQMVADAVKDVVSANQSEELKAEVATLKKELDEAKSHPTSEAALSEYKAKVISEIRQNREKKELAKSEASKQLVEKTIEGKKRLPGFQVVNATVDGQISIIKAPSGRTFALFKGEKFKATNGALLEVKEIVAEGKLVVAGDNWYIDDVLEKAQKIDLPKAAQVGNSVTQKPASSKKKESSAPVEKSTSISGWSFHASFEGGGYLVKTPGGEYKTIKKGENESGLGVIYGVDDNGNLKTEKGLIKGDI